MSDLNDSWRAKLAPVRPHIDILRELLRDRPHGLESLAAIEGELQRLTFAEAVRPRVNGHRGGLRGKGRPKGWLGRVIMAMLPVDDLETVRQWPAAKRDALARSLPGSWDHGDHGKLQSETMVVRIGDMIDKRTYPLGVLSLAIEHDASDQWLVCTSIDGQVDKRRSSDVMRALCRWKRTIRTG